MTRTNGRASRERSAGRVIAPTNPQASAAAGRTNAETPTPKGSADWRIPMARPRWSAGNHSSTSRPLAALTGPPTVPMNSRTAAAPHRSETVQSRPSAPAVRSRLKAIVHRSPARSMTSPHSSRVSRRPKDGKPASMPAWAVVTSKATRSCGSTMGTPNIAETLATWAIMPMERMTQRFRTNIRPD